MYSSSLLPTHPLKQVAAPSFSAETFTSHEVFSCSDLISVKLAVTKISLPVQFVVNSKRSTSSHQKSFVTKQA